MTPEVPPITGENGRPEPVRRIGRYEIRREIGRGMMGLVYEAIDPLLGRRIALKTIQLGFALSPTEREGFEQRFLSEARIAARLSHPGIIVVHDVGRDPESGILYMALEYLEGRTLANLIRHGALPDWRETVRIAMRIAEALSHAHDHGVIHRDIKPGNIMLLPSGEPKIMDFGIAKAETARIRLTAAGDSFGTPLYMSPEQALGQAVDRRTDLFSLGAVTYSLLVGEPAFGAESVTRIISRVVRDDPEPPSSLVAGLPADLDLVLACALAKAPADRYPDGQSLAQDFGDVLAGRRPRRCSTPEKARASATLQPANARSSNLDPLLVDSCRPCAESDLPTLDLDAELATLVSAEKPAPLPPDMQPGIGAVSARPGTGARRAQVDVPPRRRRLTERLEVPALVLLLAVGCAAVLFSWLGRRVATEGGNRATASGGAGAFVQHTAEPGRFAIDFEQSLDRSLLRVWVDRVLVVEQKLEGRGQKVTAFALRNSDVREFLELPAGGHDIEVQVAWDGKERTERIWGDFKPGGRRRLRVRLGGLIKSLSLEWQ